MSMMEVDFEGQKYRNINIVCRASMSSKDRCELVERKQFVLWYIIIVHIKNNSGTSYPPELRAKIWWETDDNLISCYLGPKSKPNLEYNVISGNNMEQGRWVNG